MGTATNHSNQKSAESLSACQEVAPFASAVHMSLMFAGLGDVCPNGLASCDVRFTEVPEPKALDAKVAVAKD